jgi:hypothetical protein
MQKLSGKVLLSYFLTAISRHELFVNGRDLKMLSPKNYLRLWMKEKTVADNEFNSERNPDQFISILRVVANIFFSEKINEY